MGLSASEIWVKMGPALSTHCSIVTQQSQSEMGRHWWNQCVLVFVGAWPLHMPKFMNISFSPDYDQTRLFTTHNGLWLLPKHEILILYRISIDNHLNYCFVNRYKIRVCTRNNLPFLSLLSLSFQSPSYLPSSLSLSIYMYILIPIPLFLAHTHTC